MRLLRWLAAWLGALVILVLKMSCRVRFHDDPRSALRRAGTPYAYSVLHAHQLATVVGGEPGTTAMVSRSHDGELLIPSLRVARVVPVRGSSRKEGRDKGGRTALDVLIEHVARGGPAYLAVDGPRGPRNTINVGIALLSQKIGAAVLNTAAVPTRRWILTGTWDRMQIPRPFSTIHGYFSEPIFPLENESLEDYRQRIEDDLNALEQKHDAQEARVARAATAHRIERRAQAERDRQEV